MDLGKESILDVKSHGDDAENDFQEKIRKKLAADRQEEETAKAVASVLGLKDEDVKKQMDEEREERNQIEQREQREKLLQQLDERHAQERGQEKGQERGQEKGQEKGQERGQEKLEQHSDVTIADSSNQQDLDSSTGPKGAVTQRGGDQREKNQREKNQRGKNQSEKNQSEKTKRVQSKTEDDDDDGEIPTWKLGSTIISDSKKQEASQEAARATSVVSESKPQQP